MTENKQFNFGVTICYKIQDDVEYERRFSDLEGFLEEDYDGEHHMLWDNQDECWVHLDEALDMMEKEYNALHEENQSLKKQLDDTIDLLAKEINSSENVFEGLLKENQHIKNSIQEAYNNERTDLGRSVLKQLLEAIE